MKLREAMQGTIGRAVALALLFSSAHAFVFARRLNSLRQLRAEVDEGDILTTALKNLRSLSKETVVIKYGGHAMGSPDARASFAQDIALLQAASINVVVVHGGGPMIADLLKRLNIETSFVKGQNQRIAPS